MDRELDVALLLQRSQLMCAQVGALMALNDVRAEVSSEQRPCTTLVEAILWGSSLGLLSKREAQDLFSLNRSANAAKHAFSIA